MTERRNYLKSTAYVIAANVITLVTGFFISPLIARILKPEAFGAYALILRTGTALPALLLFSMHSAVLYHVVRHNRERDYVGKAVTTTVGFMVLTSLVFALPLYYAVNAVAPSLGGAGFIVAYALGISLALLTLIQSVQQALEQFKQYSLLSAALALVAGVVSLSVAYYTRDPIYTAIGRTLVIAFLSLLALSFVKGLGRLDVQEFKHLFKYARPLGISGLVFTLIALVDRYILAATYSTVQVGYFDIAYTLATAVLPFTTSLLVTMAPRVIRESDKLDSYYRRLATFSVLSLSLFGLGLTVFSDIIVNLLLGKSYVPGAIEPLRLVSLALPLMAIYSLNVVVLPSLNRLRASAIMVVGLVVGSIMFNLLLIPGLASVGAAYANLATYLVMTVASVAYLRSRYTLSLRSTITQIVLYGLFYGAFVFYVQNAGFIAKVVLWLVFAAMTYLLNRKLLHEISGELYAALRSRFAPVPASPV